MQNPTEENPKRKKKKDFVTLTPPIKGNGDTEPTDNSKVNNVLVEEVKKVFRSPFTKYGG